MGTFLLFLLLFFVVIPLARGMWQLWRLRRAYRQAQQRMNDIFNGTGARDAGRNRAEQARPARKKKKIDSDVGEYVSFEEIRAEAKTSTTVDSDGNTTTRRSVKVESQVEDAEWEDL